MNKRLIIKQEEISDCGVCSLLSIMRYYHGNCSLEELRISSLTSSSGVTALNLINCAREYGFDSKGIKQKEIPVDNLPCIAHVRINESLSHFLVIYSIKNDEIEVMDPSGLFGNKMKLDKFYRISTNIYILLNPKGIIEYQLNPNMIYRKTKTFLKSNIPNLFFIILYNLIYILTNILYSFYISVLTNYFNFIYIIVFILLNIISNFMIYLINNKMNELNNDMSLSLIDSFLSHIFSLPLKYIHLKDSNEIIKRVIDLDSIKNTLLSFIITFITNALLIVIVSTLLFKFNAKLLLFVILSLIGYILITLLYKRTMSNMDEIIQSDTNYNSSLIDYIDGINSIKHTNSEKYYKDLLVSDYQTNNMNKHKYNRNILRIDFLKQSYILSIEFILNVYIIYLINSNILTFKDLIIINLLFQLIINSIISIVNYIPSILYQKKIITKINEFYNLKEEAIDDERISFRNINIINLSFSYNNYNNVINKVYLKINKGDKLIIKGESGCGKSTLCKLLNKEYTKYSGNILLNNINYNNISVSKIRSMICYSSQNEIIFHGTIKDNILMGHDINTNDLNKIIKVCELERIISKKVYGLDTYLYGGAGELSGGERQLIILARALVLNKDILILDESLSEVNDNVENRVLRKLFKYYKNKTIIYVSHKNKKEYFKRTIYV